MWFRHLAFVSLITFTLGIFATVHSASHIPTIALYGLYETTIDYQVLTGQSHSFADPFYGVDLNTTFTSPTGRQIIWWGFYDGDGQGNQGGDIWKIRFMPDELGTWTFTWQFSDGSLSGSGSFEAVDTVANPRKPGPLKHDPTINQWLMTADGSRHVFLNMYAGPSNLSEDNIATAIPILVARAKSTGFDVAHLSGPIHHNFLSSVKDANNPWIYMNTNDYTPRLQGWHVFENAVLSTLYDEEIYLFPFYGFYGGNNLFDLNTRSTSFQNKVLRYHLSRTAPYYVYLHNIGFELEEYVTVPTWPVERATWIKSIDPWDHLITGHELSDFNYGNYPIMDFSAMQKNDNFHNLGIGVWNSPAQPHPHCNECIWNAPWQSQGTEQSHRKDLWDGITAGMSNAFLAIDNDIGETAFQNANAFLKSGVKWWTMAPHDEVVVSGTAYVLANLGAEYIVYSSSGSSFTITLPAGAYNWRWFNPADGIYTQWTSLNTNGENVAFNKSNTNDWVLHMRNDSTPDMTPPAPPTGLVVE